MGFLFGTIRIEPQFATDSECNDPVATAASPLEQVQKSETMREFVGAKLHGLRVTGKSLEYEAASITWDASSNLVLLGLDSRTARKWLGI